MTRHRRGLRKLCRLGIRQIRQAERRHLITPCSPAECGELKTPTAGHRRTPIQSASAIAAEADAGTNAGTLERQNLRICQNMHIYKSCVSAQPAYLQT